MKLYLPLSLEVLVLLRLVPVPEIIPILWSVVGFVRKVIPDLESTFLLLLPHLSEPRN